MHKSIKQNHVLSICGWLNPQIWNLWMQRPHCSAKSLIGLIPAAQGRGKWEFTFNSWASSSICLRRPGRLELNTNTDPRPSNFGLPKIIFNGFILLSKEAATHYLKQRPEFITCCEGDLYLEVMVPLNKANMTLSSVWGSMGLRGWETFRN